MSLWGDRLAEVWAPPGRAGSGVVVGTRGVLTARHVVEGAIRDGGEPPLARVVRPGAEVGAWVPTAVTWEREGWDVVLLTVAPEADRWLAPRSPDAPIVALGHAAEPACEATGFPQAEVVPDPESLGTRQSEQVVGMVLPAGQGKPPVQPDRPLTAGRWVPLDAETATPGTQAGWGGMSGAGVVLPDGGLVGLVIAAEREHQTRRLYVLPLAAALAAADGLAAALRGLLGRDVFARARTAATWERLLTPACLGADGLPLVLSAADDLGAFGVKAGDVPGEPPYLRYVPRDDDEALARAIEDAVEERRMVLVVGGSATGKSRSAAEAVSARLGDHRLLRPQAGRLGELAEAPLGDAAPAVVWLDDVQVYAHPAFGDTLARLLDDGLVVVGTIRRAELAALDAPGDLRNPIGEALSDPRLVHRVNWRTAWSPAELTRLGERTSSPELHAAAAGGTPPGAYCVAGPALVRRLVRARDDEDHPATFWLVRTVLDWFRAGTKRPMPLQDATRIAALRAAPGGGLGPDAFEDALREALRSEFTVPPSSPPPSLLSRDADDGLRVHDYLLDDDQRDDTVVVPDDVWSCAIAHGSPDDLAAITTAAFAAGRRDQAVAAATPLAEAGSADAMFNLGVVAWQEDREAALGWWRRAAEAGQPSAMVNVGVSLKAEDPAAARDWYERAIATGHRGAMLNLGILLQDDDPAAARGWYERAADEGDPGAMLNLGNLLKDDEPATARAWYERSAAAGQIGAMYNIGMLDRETDPANAAVWFRRAADAGHRAAMLKLGLLLLGDDPTTARDWIARAADAGERDAMYNLGVLLEDDDPAASRGWFQRAADAGDTDAAARLAGAQRSP